VAKGATRRGDTTTTNSHAAMLALGRFEGPAAALVVSGGGSFVWDSWELARGLARTAAISSRRPLRSQRPAPSSEREGLPRPGTPGQQGSRAAGQQGRVQGWR